MKQAKTVAGTEDGRVGEGGNIEKKAGLVSMDEAIALLKTSRPTFYRWVRQGKVRGVKAGRQWRFRREELERFLAGEAPTIEIRGDIRPLFKELGIKAGAAGEGGDAILKAVIAMIMRGVADEASDIHVGPEWDEASRAAVGTLRYRLNGAMLEPITFDARLLPAIIEKWKTMASCDVNERKKPQDGRILLNVKDKEIDLRVSFLPVCLGEAATARVLVPEKITLDLARLNYLPKDKEKLAKAMKAQSGLILFAGARGSGTTTALYSCLNTIKGGKKVISIENPVEYLLPGVTQVQLNPQSGLTCAAALRSALRSAPNVVAVGEIRDAETLALALDAALEGVLVFASIPAEDTAAVLANMLNMGITPMAVAGAVKLVISQRLIRTLCPKCGKKAKLDAKSLKLVKKLTSEGGIRPAKLPKRFKKAIGCAKCHGTGYSGRELIGEALEMTPSVARALRSGADAAAIRKAAVRGGMTTIAAHGIVRAASGETTIDEAARALGIIL